MKRGTVFLVFIVVAALIGAGMAFAAGQQPSIEKGKALFNDPKLGSTGKSCNDCHPNGKGAEKAAGQKGLEHVVNGCITGALKGKPLDVKSPEMQSLILYINTFGASKQETKKPAVGC